MKKIFLLGLICFGNLNAYQYDQPHFPYYSQVGQDKFLNETLFKNKRDGVFVDVGAHDGIAFSNSYYFEKELGWTGICIEPHPFIFPQLKANRTAKCYQVCASNEEGNAQFIKVNGSLLEMLSGMLTTYDPRQLGVLDWAVDKYDSNYEILNIPSRTLTSLLEENNLFEIDFLSIDTEGGEREILEGLDFNRFKIKCIIVENNWPDKFAPIEKMLTDHNYIHKIKYAQDEIFVLAGAFE